MEVFPSMLKSIPNGEVQFYARVLKSTAQFLTVQDLHNNEEVEVQTESGVPVLDANSIAQFFGVVSDSKVVINSAREITDKNDLFVLLSADKMAYIYNLNTYSLAIAQQKLVC